MPKPKAENRDLVTSRDGVTVAFRLSPIEDRALKALIEKEQAEIDSRGAPYRASAASVLRTLLRAKAVADGVWDGTGRPVPTAAPATTAGDPRQRTIYDVPNVEKSAPTPTPPAQNRGEKEAPARSLADRLAQVKAEKLMPMAQIGAELKVDPASITKWLNGRRPIPAKYESQLEAILTKLGVR